MILCSGLFFGLFAGPAHGEDKGPDGFKILIWQYQTDVLKDYALYQDLGLGGFHIDRGKGEHERVRFSLDRDFPYYVDHAADKGFLYLKGKSREAVTGKTKLLTRPVCLADPLVIEDIKRHIRANVTDTKKGHVLAYALDDEISLGTFTNPGDVDVHPLVLERFRQWLKTGYGDIEALNRQWDTGFKAFGDVVPKGFEEVRTGLSHTSFADWNLSAWMDFRHFMDIHFSGVISDLVEYVNSIDPQRPAGFVGGLAPSPWGGYDYGLLADAVQWMEAYDIHGTNEMLRSFWNETGKLRMQTFFSQRDRKMDSWFLWYHLVHGSGGVIAWPEGWFREKGGKREIDEAILALKDVFRAVQGPVGRRLTGPGARFSADPIGIYYSHPSVQAGWVMDALVHGKTWPKRLASIDNENQSAGVLRKVWCKTIEDLSLQYDFINYRDVRQGLMDLNERFKVIVLPKTSCLSDGEAQVLRRYVEKGGVLVADYLCGIFDEHGRFREKGVLDDVFGIDRDDRAGYLNGRGVTEIDAEKYASGFPDRFTFYRGADYQGRLVVVERGTKERLYQREHGRGRAHYLNVSPVAYWHSGNRDSAYGDQWRGVVAGILAKAGVLPRVTLEVQGRAAGRIEAVFREKNGDLFLGLVQNPTDNVKAEVTQKPVRITLRFKNEVGLADIKNQKNLGQGRVFEDDFKPWEANLYQVFVLE